MKAFLVPQFSLIGVIFLALIACNEPAKRQDQKTQPDSLIKQSTANKAPETGYTSGFYSDEQSRNPKHFNRLLELLDSFAQTSMLDEEIRGIAIHFTDLRSGANFTINPDMKFVPASLLKIPILIAVYKFEESYPGSLSKKIPHQATHQNNMDMQLIENEAFVYQMNKQYSVQEYLEIMIRYSDNDATLSLLKFLDAERPGFINKVEKDLGASIPNTVGNMEDIVQVGHFSKLMTAVYEAKYLDLAHSEAALKLLSSSRYPEGFRKKLPADLRIAHKYGVRFNISNINPTIPVQLNQVAIIYHPKGPFLLSVMTKGNKLETLRSVLQESAFIAYDYMEHLPD